MFKISDLARGAKSPRYHKFSFSKNFLVVNFFLTNDEIHKFQIVDKLKARVLKSLMDVVPPTIARSINSGQ